MGKKINIEKSQIIEIEGYEMVLTITKEESTNRLLATIESQSGGSQITIGQHEELPNTIFFGVEKPSGLSLVED